MSNIITLFFLSIGLTLLGQSDEKEIDHSRLEFSLLGVSYENPISNETEGIDPFWNLINLKLGVFPMKNIPIGIEIGFNVKEINSPPNTLVYELPENQLGINNVDFQNFNQLLRTYYSLVYAPSFPSKIVSPFLSAGLSRGRIYSGFNLEERTSSWDFWNESIEGIKNKGWFFRIESGINYTPKRSMITFSAGMTWYRSFSTFDYINVKERKTCTAYTSGNIDCPDFGEQGTFPVVSSEVPFYVSLPKYNSIVNLIGFNIGVVFRLLSYNHPIEID